jgi:cystine transport system substrate-binding protein
VTPPRALRALAGGLGVIVGAIGCAAVVGAILVALGLPPASRADEPPPVVQPRPTELVVALTLSDPTMQAGVVRAGDVILARGLEIDIARELGRRLRIPKVRFVYVRPAQRLLASEMPPWQLVIASIRPSRAASSVTDLSEPYVASGQAVILRRGLPPATRLADLRGKIVCAVRGSEGAHAIPASVTPGGQVTLASSSSRLLQLVQTGACDAALVDAPGVGRFVAGKGGVLGPVRARIDGEDGYVVGVTRGGPIAVAEVSRALRRMRADGTLHRLARSWLGIDPSRLRPLR